MAWKGVVIEESLEHKGLLDLVTIVRTKRAFLEGEKGRGVLHFHLIEVGDQEEGAFVRAAEKSIKNGWYIHICKDGIMVVIYRGRAFEFMENQKEGLEEARAYGLSLGIPEGQLTFENLIKNPFS